MPGWLRAIDTAALLLTNLALAAAVTIVFLNMMLRAFFNVSLISGVEELSRLYLVMLAFLGGGVAYGRGNFVAMTSLVRRLPTPLRDLCNAAVQWFVMLVAVVIGTSSIPLQILNASERTPLLGIDFVWMTLPMMVGCALFLSHAGLALSRLPRAAVTTAAVTVALVVTALVVGREGDWIDTNWFFVVLAATFLIQLGIGVPVGFVLGSVGILYIWSTGSAPLVTIASTAQRGAGGFIFLALPFFVLAGFVMDRGGIGTRIVDFVTSLIGHMRGGLLQVLIVGMYVVSGMSGSKAADMAAIGIPMNKNLRRHGYDPSEAAAVLAVSSAMGESIPPSIAVLALSSVTSVSAGALFLAGLLPAATIAACLMALVYFRVAKGETRPSERASFSDRLTAGRRAIIPLFMPVLLIGGIVGGVGTPTEVSSSAVIYGLLLGTALYRRIGRREYRQLLTEASLLGGMIFFTFSGATLLSLALSLEGVPDVVAGVFQTLGGGVFLPALIAITIIFGAILESVVTIVILGPLLLPVALHLGIHPLQYGIVLIEAYGIGSIIPPVGLALYIACSICQTNVGRTARFVTSYIVILCLGLLLVAFVPWITLVVPRVFHFKG